SLSCWLCSPRRSCGWCSSPTSAPRSQRGAVAAGVGGGAGGAVSEGGGGDGAGGGIHARGGAQQARSRLGHGAQGREGAGRGAGASESGGPRESAGVAARPEPASAVRLVRGVVRPVRRVGMARREPPPAGPVRVALPVPAARRAPAARLGREVAWGKARRREAGRARLVRAGALAPTAPAREASPLEPAQTAPLRG